MARPSSVTKHSHDGKANLSSVVFASGKNPKGEVGALVILHLYSYSVSGYCPEAINSRLCSYASLPMPK